MKVQLLKSRDLLSKKSSPEVLPENEHAVLFVKTLVHVPVDSCHNTRTESFNTALKVEELFNDCDASVGLSNISDTLTCDSHSDSVRVHIVNVDIHN